jgi:outer membrane protein TolC
LRFFRPGRRFLLAAGVLSWGSTLAQTPTSSSPSTGQAIPGTLGVVSPFAGSTPAQLTPGVLPLSLQDAIDRGLKKNLGLLLSDADVRAARGQRWEQLSALLPHLSVAFFGAMSKINLAELGFSGAGPVAFPPSVGPFSFFDARVTMAQSVFDWKSITAVRAAAQSLQSAEYSYRDARDLVVLAVGYVYLQAIADEARIDTAEAQLKTARALHQQAADRVKAGTSPAIDELRAKVERQTREQQLIQAKNNFAIQKLTVARVIGLPPGQEFEFTDKSPYHAFGGLRVDDALARAYRSRADYGAALTGVRAAELSRAAAVAGYYPSLSFNGDFGAAGGNFATATSVFEVRGTLSIPLFEGGSVHGAVLQADAKLGQSRDRLENLRAQIDSDVRTALLNLQSSGEQVEVARSNIEVAEETLIQSRDRFGAGVTDTVEVVQSQEAVASAHEQFIASLYAYNFAKISLARALGAAEEGVEEFFRGR